MFNTAAVNSPLPLKIAHKAPYVLLIGPLTASLMARLNKLFFISHCVPGSGITKWSLVRVTLRDSLRKHPNALQDGRFLVDFYTYHPKDKLFNAINSFGAMVQYMGPFFGTGYAMRLGTQTDQNITILPY